MDVLFHKVAEDSNTIIVKTAAIDKVTRTFNGKTATVRTQGNAKFGLLVIMDEETGETVDPRSYGFKPNQVLEGIRLSDSPVLDQESGEETGLFWAEPYDKQESED